MNRDDFFPGKYMKTNDVENVPFVGRITSVAKESVNTDKGLVDKPVMYFSNSEKGFIINATNYTTLSEIFNSDETNDWRGKVVELFAAETSYGGKRMRGIRVREPQAQGAKAPRRTRRPASEAESQQTDLEEYLDDSVPFS